MRLDGGWADREQLGDVLAAASLPTNAAPPAFAVSPSIRQQPQRERQHEAGEQRGANRQPFSKPTPHLSLHRNAELRARYEP